MGDVTQPLLEVKNLSVSFRTEAGVVRAVDGISFALERGEVLGIVGESGSGKSVMMLSVMRLLVDPNVVFEGQIIFKGSNLLEMSRREIERIRGAEIAMVFQDPMTSLNPVYRVGWQIVEQLQAHSDMSRKQARERALDLLAGVGIPNPRGRIDDYPHQFSGGMRQRVMVAMALSCRPDLLIADEPTTALDVTIQAQILKLIKDLRSELGSSVVLITHDMGVVADIADRVLVMYAGRVVEQGVKRELFYDPQHPYTWGLLGSIPRLDRARGARLSSIPGTPPSLIHPPSGCHFHPRCVHRIERCVTDDPALTDKLGNGHLDACHLEIEVKRRDRDSTSSATVGSP